MRGKKSFVGIAVIFSVLLFVFKPAHPAALSEIEKGLMCYCGCAGMVLSSCQCATAEKMRANIQSKLDQGVPPERIIQDYVAMYGEKILSAPTKRGFNLTAWIAPFVGVAAGLVFLYFIAREFVRRGRKRLADAVHSGEIPAQMRVELDEELKDYL